MTLDSRVWFVRSNQIPCLLFFICIPWPNYFAYSRILIYKYQNNTDLIKLSLGLNKVIYVNSLAQHLAWIYFQQWENHKSVQITHLPLLPLLLEEWALQYLLTFIHVLPGPQFMSWASPLAPQHQYGYHEHNTIPFTGA